MLPSRRSSAPVRSHLPDRSPFDPIASLSARLCEQHTPEKLCTPLSSDQFRKVFHFLIRGHGRVLAISGPS